jgi:hypothetical protein
MIKIKSLHLGISLEVIGTKKNMFWRFRTGRNRLHKRRNRLHLSAALQAALLDLQHHCVIDYTYGVIN